MKVYKSTCGKEFWVTNAQLETIENLKASRKGGCATVHGYVSKSGYVTGKPSTQDINMITRISIPKLYERRLSALNEIRFSDIPREDIEADIKLSGLTESELQKAFSARKAQMTNTLSNTLDGERNNNHHKAHDRCYAKIADGVSVHLKTETVDGIKQPILLDGYAVANSIMVKYVQLSKKVTKAGEYKVVNSGIPVRMGELIEKQLNSKSHCLKQVSLKPENFTSLKIDRKEILSEDTKGLADILA